MRNGVMAFVALAALAAWPGAARAQPVDLAVTSVEVRGDASRPGAQLTVTARIQRVDRGPPDSLVAVVRFHAAGEPRPFAERRVPLAPNEAAAVTAPWSARAGRSVISISIGVGSGQAVDRQPRNDVMTTRDIVVAARGARETPEPATALVTRSLAIASAPARAIATPTLTAVSAPTALVATGALSLTSAPPIAIAARGLAAASAPPTPIATGALTLATAPALAVTTAPLGMESRPEPTPPADQPAGDQPASDQPPSGQPPSDQPPPNQPPANQPGGDQPARQP